MGARSHGGDGTPDVQPLEGRRAPAGAPLSPPGTHTSAVVFAGSTPRRAKPSASFLHRVATRPYAEPNLPSEP